MVLSARKILRTFRADKIHLGPNREKGLRIGLANSLGGFRDRREYRRRPPALRETDLDSLMHNENSKRMLARIRKGKFSIGRSLFRRRVFE